MTPADRIATLEADVEQIVDAILVLADAQPRSDVETVIHDMRQRLAEFTGLLEMMTTELRAIRDALT